MLQSDEHREYTADAERGALGEIELIDEDGNATKFAHLLTLNHNNESYLALTGIQRGEDQDHDEITVGFLRIVPQKDGGDVYRDDIPEEIVEELFVKLNEHMEETFADAGGE
ncbi:MAG: DUF1292 domain-containing protein [Oscillospiraceae bacterium]|jgi:uncharacterized protein YrzB (UPF0473 family)|nr:DUF1292 domain-containing protein [Oscillospiraceae bacterium]